MKIKVLDDGHVRLVDRMGDDSSVVQAARISYGAGTKTKREDGKLIHYLMRKRHTSPFEQVEFKFHIRLTMDTWRQGVRHRTAHVNEYSTRYSEAINSMYHTAPDAWRLQSKDNKQGSCGYLSVEEGKILSDMEIEYLTKARGWYEFKLSKGIAREQARKDLPLSTYTEIYWKIDLHNLFHFLSLRLDSHAQWEIRQYAIAIARIVSDVVPICWEAFVRYRLMSVVDGDWIEAKEKYKDSYGSVVSTGYDSTNSTE